MTIALPVVSTPAPIARGVDGDPPRAPDRAHHAGRLIDAHGRTIRDLRLSVTDRCNFRCVYCMDPDVRFLDGAGLLSDEQMVRVARVCVGLGVRRIRLTGGEPTLHPTLETLIGSLADLGLDDLSLTTNASLLDEERLVRWRRAGLRRVTVSIDSLREDRFARITRSAATPGRVIEAIGSINRAGLRPVKINAVVIRGFNDDEIEDLGALAREHGADVRLIEFMPLDSGRRWSMASVVSADEILEKINRRFPLVAAEREHVNSPARSYTFADGSPGRIGVIASVTRAFCGECSRLRLTADGKIRPCLFSTREWDIRPHLERGADDDALARFLVDAVWTKQAGHAIASAAYEQPDRPMSAIGG